MAKQNTEGGGRWPVDRLKPIVEALVFAAADPLSVKAMGEILEGTTAAEIKAALTALQKDLQGGRGVRLSEVAGGWQLRTAPEHYRVVKRLFRERPYRLTRAATETLAIVAYRQPVTKAEVESIRGVDASGVLESLLERRLLRIAGRRDGPGRPLLYATTGEFLELFGLKDLNSLPTLGELGDEFETMADEGDFLEAGGDGHGVLPLENEGAEASLTEQGKQGEQQEEQEQQEPGESRDRRSGQRDQG